MLKLIKMVFDPPTGAVQEQPKFDQLKVDPDRPDAVASAKFTVYGQFVQVLFPFGSLNCSKVHKSISSLNPA